MTEISIIIPMLNEERYIRQTLRSIECQIEAPWETVCIDGGSADGTGEIVKEFVGGRSNPILVIRPQSSELECRNLGATISSGNVLLFLSADVIMPPHALGMIARDFQSNHNLIGITGRPFPFEATQMLRLEYHTWNVLKILFDRLPRPLRTFVTSSSFLAIRKDVFLRVGGFDVSDVNADGILGPRLMSLGDILFDTAISYSLSGRRYNKSGFWSFNQTFAYNVAADFFPFLSRISWLNRFKNRIKAKHVTVS